jgi:hypothetical protein
MPTACAVGLISLLTAVFLERESLIHPKEGTLEFNFALRQPGLAAPLSVQANIPCLSAQFGPQVPCVEYGDEIIDGKLFELTAAQSCEPDGDRLPAANNSIVLVPQGLCAFTTKAEVASRHGAKAVVLIAREGEAFEAGAAPGHVGKVAFMCTISTDHGKHLQLLLAKSATESTPSTVRLQASFKDWRRSFSQALFDSLQGTPSDTALQVPESPPQAEDDENFEKVWTVVFIFYGRASKFRILNVYLEKNLRSAGVQNCTF